MIASRARGPLGTLAVLAVALVALTPSASARRPASVASAHATVVLRDISFHAERVTIRRGGTVTWRWRDGSGANAVPHTVTSTSKPRFRSADARKSGNYTVRFAARGVYRYECTIHVGMTGRVTVR